MSIKPKKLGTFNCAQCGGKYVSFTITETDVAWKGSAKMKFTWINKYAGYCKDGSNWRYFCWDKLKNQYHSLNDDKVYCYK